MNYDDALSEAVRDLLDADLAEEFLPLACTSQAELLAGLDSDDRLGS